MSESIITEEELLKVFEGIIEKYMRGSVRVNPHFKNTCYAGYAVSNGINHGYKVLRDNAELLSKKYGVRLGRTNYLIG